VEPDFSTVDELVRWALASAEEAERTAAAGDVVVGISPSVQVLEEIADRTYRIARQARVRVWMGDGLHMRQREVADDLAAAVAELADEVRADARAAADLISREVGVLRETLVEAERQRQRVVERLNRILSFERSPRRVVRVSDHLWENVKRRAEARGESVHEIVQRAFERYLESGGPP
jgi:hypothetical protein